MKKLYVKVRTDVAPPLPVRIRSHFDGPPPPLSANVIIECPFNEK